MGALKRGNYRPLGLLGHLRLTVDGVFRANVISSRMLRTKMSMPSLAIAASGPASGLKVRSWPVCRQNLPVAANQWMPNVQQARNRSLHRRPVGIVPHALAPSQPSTNLALTGTVAPADLPGAADYEVRQRLESRVRAQEEAAHDWTRNWYPLATLSDLDRERPNSLQLLGSQVAVWWDEANDVWHAVEDRCSHRMAALSDGHISRAGDVVCPYHGWQFDGRGNCTHNPQAIDAALELSACSDSRARVSAYPVQERHGLLWLWGRAGGEEFIHSAAKAPPTAPEADNDDWLASPYLLVHLDGVGYETMMENSFDPSHSSFVHNGILQTWEEAVPMFAKLVSAIEPMEGFRLEHSGYTKSQAALVVERHFSPPCTLRATYKSGTSTTVFAVHCTPVRPGVCTTFFREVMHRTGVSDWKNSAVNIMTDSNSTSWLTGFKHMAGNAIADQDMLVLHRQDQRLHRAELAAAAVAAAGSKRRGWRQYYLATPSDVGVDAFRRWLDMAGGGPQYEGEHLYPSEKSLVQLQDRWIRHVSRCKDCKQTIRVLELAAGALSTASWATFAGALWLAGAAAPRGSLISPVTVTGEQHLMGVLMPLYLVAAAAVLQLLHGCVEFRRKEFHPPERAARFPLNSPDI